VVSGNRIQPGDCGLLGVGQPEENQTMPASLSALVVASVSRVQLGDCGLLDVGQLEAI
jgi:hypothetical protein